MKKFVHKLIYTSIKEKFMYKILGIMKLLSERMPRKNYFPQQEFAYQNLPGVAGKRIPQ